MGLIFILSVLVRIGVMVFFSASNFLLKLSELISETSWSDSPVPVVVVVVPCSGCNINLFDYQNFLKSPHMLSKKHLPSITTVVAKNANKKKTTFKSLKESKI